MLSVILAVCHVRADQAKPAQLWDAQGQSMSYTQDLWPFVLLGVVFSLLLPRTEVHERTTAEVVESAEAIAEVV